MKKLVILFVLALVIISCKNETKEENSTKDTTAVEDTQNSNSSLKTIRGEFLFIDGAGVIMGTNFIYGVTIDEMTEELIKQASSKQRDKFDMVPIVIKGEVNPKPAGKDVWDEIVTIKEIIDVLPPKGEEPIKIETGK